MEGGQPNFDMWFLKLVGVIAIIAFAVWCSKGFSL